ncbi:MAG: PCRF domain-containing protein, partial [Candidatus Gracilibacteria bacterium]|nr:PCRF domain-containing protein [Candidatus Gracilibacteria bacterium]
MFNLDNLVVEFQKLELELANPEIFKDQKKVREVSSRKKQISLAVELYKDYKKAKSALAEAVEMLYQEKDEDMRDLAKMQKDESEDKIMELEEKLKYALLPQDKNDDKSIIVEVRAGAGGEEAALFAGELSKSYMIFAEECGFKTEINEQTLAESGGIKEIIFEIKGEGAYSKFKYESGVHRVQRIPETESKGRVHTSAITVAILPEVDDLDIEIKDSDLDIKATRASGAGGQHVNKTDSAIHMT